MGSESQVQTPPPPNRKFKFIETGNRNRKFKFIETGNRNRNSKPEIETGNRNQAHCSKTKIPLFLRKKATGFQS